MHITFFSFMSSVVWSSVLIVGIYFLRKIHRFKSGFGLSALVLLYIFSIVRMFFPWEFPQTIEIGVEKVYPSIYRFLTNDRIGSEYFHFSLLHMLSVIWLVGASALLLRYVAGYRKTMHSIMKHASPCGEREMVSFETVKRDVGKSANISLYTVPGITVPFGIGMLRKSILLPEREYTDSELYFIFLHEYMHFMNHDIPVKVLISIFCCVFWWNPIVYLLKADLEQTMEMKCDAAVARRLDTQGRVTYLRTIVSIMKQFSASDSVPYTSTALFRMERTLGIKERFDVVVNCSTEQNQILSKLCLSLICMLTFLASYVIVPQPTFKAPKSIEPNAIDFNSTNSYIKQNSNGDYWLCIESQEPTRIPADLVEFFRQTGLSIIKE